MEGNWDTYLCRVDDKPAQILLDLDLMARAPLKDYPVLGYISISMQDPDEDGFPQQEEHELFSEIEEFLVDVLTAKESAVYAGSCTTDGRFDLFFYMRFVGGWANSLENALQDYDDLEWETGLQEDPDWTSYRAFLYPDDQAMLEIQNRRVLEQLSEIGDDLSNPRMIDHFAGFPTRELALAFAEAVEEEGFLLSGADAGKVTYFAPPAENGDSAGVDAGAEADDSGAGGADSGAGAGDSKTDADAGAGPADSGAADSGADFGPDSGDAGSLPPEGHAGQNGLETQDATGQAMPDTTSEEAPEDSLDGVTESLEDDPLIDEPFKPETAFRVQFSRRDAPEDIDDISFPLAELALSFQGSYLGWATPMIR